MVAQKLTVPQLFPTIHVTRTFFTAFTSVRHLSVSWARMMQSIPSYTASWKSISLLSFNLCLFFQVVSFPQVSLPIACTPLLSSENVSCPGNHILLDLITRKIFDDRFKSLSSSLFHFLHSPVTSTLLNTNIPLTTLISNTLNLRSSLNMSNQVSHPYKTTAKLYLNL